MTNEELIAKARGSKTSPSGDNEIIIAARELLEQELDYHGNSPHEGADVVCRLITTHLAEMDEHEPNQVTKDAIEEARGMK